MHSATDRRLTIGFLNHHLTDSYGRALWLAMADQAQEQDVNLICFVGGSLRSSLGFEAQGNTIYDLAGAENLDGLIIGGGVASAYVDPDETRAFFGRYDPLPIVSIATLVEHVPTVLVDNRTGMREQILHLANVHGRRRIAFIQGPTRNQEAEDRYRVYTQALEELGLVFDPDLVAPGEFEETSGMKAIDILLDERGADFDAVIAANDYMALGAFEALKARGIQVPQDVALAGFDDVEESKTITPSLTTVRQPLYEIVQQAILMLLKRIAGEAVPEQITLPTEFVARESCGCRTQAVLEAGLEGAAQIAFATSADSPTERESLCAAVRKAVEASTSGLEPGWAEELLNAFLADLEPATPQSFIGTLEKALERSLSAGGEPAGWHNTIAMLHRYAHAHLPEDARGHAETLRNQAHVLIGEIAERTQVGRRLLSERQSEALRDVGNHLISTFDLAALMDMVARDLPALGIDGCYLSLYERQAQPNTPPEPVPTCCSRLILAYDESGRIRQKEMRRFPSCKLAPDGLLPTDKRYTMLAEPLYFCLDQFGFALFRVGLTEGNIYETLRIHLSSALKGALLFQQMIEREQEHARLLADLEKRALQLQTAAEVSRAASSILDPDALMQQVVRLARDRFELYYAGLFLVDRSGEWTGEAGRWAVLRAGTGDAGQKMLEQGHKLEVGGSSMIGWCVSRNQARIALDVGEEAVRFDNPLLPETHSEIALPLTSRGRAIGALTIQSAQEAAFSEEDVAVLQTMADQLANAITNANLYEQAQREIAERKRAEEALALQAKKLDAELEQFARVAAHDLQEPLRLVASYVQLLERRYKGQLGEDADEFITYAVDGATRIKALISDLLIYSRVDTRGKPFAPTDCSTLVEQVLANLERVIRENDAVVTFDGLPTVTADANQLVQVFHHLIHNALEFHADRRPEVTIGAELGQGEWLFSIRDNGIGIEPRYFERIFALFQRLQGGKEHSGTGIGLALCKKIVERHGGRIWVESEPGRGSTFTFTLPATDKEVLE